MTVSLNHVYTWGVILLLFVGFLWVCITNKENYSGTKSHPRGRYVPDFEDNGMERALWGPLMPVQTKAMENQKYLSIHSTPACVPPLNEYSEACLNTYIPDLHIPYELNKI